MTLFQVYNQINKHIGKYGLVDTLHLMFHVAFGLVDYYFNPFSIKTSKLPVRDWLKIKEGLLDTGLQVITYQIDVSAFYKWLDLASFPGYYKKLYGKVFIEKALEHYMGAELLNMSPNSILIDVAASNSPWVNIAPRLYRIKAIALDLKFPTVSILGDKLVSDATQMPLLNESIDSMVLHCAYEMFEGDADSRLIMEASRVLKKGGKLVILPLYLHHFYFVDSSPGADRRNISYQGAKRVWRDDDNSKLNLGGVRFSRKYDIKTFIDRVVKYKGPMDLKIIYFENEKDVDSNCYLKFAAVFEKKSKRNPI